MAALIFAKHDNASLNDATAKTLTAAKAIGVLVAGENAAGVAEAAARLDGVKKLIHVEGAGYGHRLAEPLTDLLVSMAGPYEHIVFPGKGKNMPMFIRDSIERGTVSRRKPAAQRGGGPGRNGGADGLRARRAIQRRLGATVIGPRPIGT